MSNKKGKTVITGATAEERLKQALKLVSALKKEVSDERKTMRTRGLILLGSPLAGAIQDEGKRFEIYKELIHNDAVIRNPKAPGEKKDRSRRRTAEIVIALAKMLAIQLENEVGKTPPDPAKGKPGTDSGVA